MNTYGKANLIINPHAVIGEGPNWNAALVRLIWMDNAHGIVYEVMQDSAGLWQESRRWNLGRTTGAAIPRAGGGFVITAGTDILMLSETGRITPFTHVDADADIVKLNDARCDPQGRLWTGTYAHDFSPGRGALYRVDPDGSVTTILKGVGLSNGLDWSPDGGTFYYIDSLARTVDAFDFDGPRGLISHRRSVVSIPLGEGAPDGMTVDQEGCLWIAIFGSGEVRRYSPTGEFLGRVQVSALTVTSCAFGGADGGDLFISTAALRIPDAVLPVLGCTADIAERAFTAPGAGGLFVCRPGVKGRPETVFAG